MADEQDERVDPLLEIQGSNFIPPLQIGDLQAIHATADAARKKISSYINFDSVGTAGGELRKLLAQPFNQICAAYEAYVGEQPTKAGLKRLLQVARAEFEAVRNGASLFPDSPLDKAIAQSGNQYSRFGMLVAAFGYKIDPESDTFSRTLHPNNAPSFSSGMNAVVSAGLVGGATSAIQIRALDGQAKRLDAAVDEFGALQKELHEASREWERSRQTSAGQTDERVSKLISENVDRINDLYSSHTEKLDAIERRFKERLIMGKPANYWKRRSTLAAVISIISFVGFGALVTFFVWMAATVAPSHLGNIISSVRDAVQVDPNSGENFSGMALVFSFALISTPAIMALWTLMLVSRVFRENLHLANDANHRHMLITTYLSLVEDDGNPISKEDREYALNAIFSVPSEASADDAITSIVFPRMG